MLNRKILIRPAIDLIFAVVLLMAMAYRIIENSVHELVGIHCGIITGIVRKIAGVKAGVAFPQQEESVLTNFIR